MPILLPVCSRYSEFSPLSCFTSKYLFPPYFCQSIAKLRLCTCILCLAPRQVSHPPEATVHVLFLGQKSYQTGVWGFRPMPSYHPAEVKRFSVNSLKEITLTPLQPNIDKYQAFNKRQPIRPKTGICTLFSILGGRSFSSTEQLWFCGP